MEDRELLELAAKAAGYTFNWGMQPLILAVPADMDRPWQCWNPLTEDGDALRLAVKMNISIEQYPWGSEATFGKYAITQIGDDPCATTRRAIVRAAAEIGKAAA